MIKTGQRYSQESERYLLSQVAENMVCLIKLSNGNRFADPVKVENIENISPQEWHQITCRTVFHNGKVNMLYFSKANAKTINLLKVAVLNKYLKNNRKVYSLDISSGITCPGAKDCHSWVKVDRQTNKAKIVDGPHCIFRCFSATQEALFERVRVVRASNYDQIRNAGDVDETTTLILNSLPKNAGIIRLHVGGDFFSITYMQAIVELAKLRPDILFYFYTKSLQYLKFVIYDIPTANLSQGIILPNLLVTGSKGGNYDYLLESLHLRKAIVVYSEDEANQLGLVIDHDDSHAALPGGDFALLIHGVQPKGSLSSKALVALKGKGNE